MKVSIHENKRKATGKINLSLCYYEKGVRSYRSLGIYLFDSDFQKLTNEQKRHNKEKLQEAKMICAAESEKVRLGKFGIETIQKQRSSFLAFVERVARERNTSKGNEGNWDSMLKHLKNFLTHDITFEQVDVKLLNDFKGYLDKVVQNTGKPLSQNTKSAYYNKLRASLKQAVNEDIITKNPAANTTGFKEEEVTREYLTNEEIKQAYKAECDVPILKRAFLFSCFTGLRWSDIMKLKWSEIIQDDSGSFYLKFRQQKTKGIERQHIAHEALEFIGERGNPDELVFKGLKYSSWNNQRLLQWMMRAGVTKTITFHCARHTYAAVQLGADTDFFTLSKLLGHRDLKTTLVYSKILDKKVKEAAERINIGLHD
jgi:integrase